MLKRITAIMLSAAMILTGVFALPPESDAADVSGDLNAVKLAGYTYYGNLIDVSVYNDELFTRDSRQFDTQLAVISMNLAQASIDARKRKDFGSYCLLREYLTDNGFTDFEANEDYNVTKSNEVTTAVACAHKKIKDKDGKTYTLLVIEPRGATVTSGEWETTFTASGHANDQGDHAGYSACRDKVLEFARYYVDKYKIKGDLKVWTTGFSRSAGFTNLVGAELVDHPRTALGSDISLARKDIFCYNYGCPRAAGSAECRAERYNCIHNIVDHGDILANFPLVSYYFDRYGQDHAYADTAKHDKMLDYMRTYYSRTYRSYLNGGDPDDFTPYKIDIDALKSGNLAFVKDTASYLPYDRGEFMDSVIETIARTAEESATSGDSYRQRARNGYYAVYQKPMSDFTVAMLSVGFSTDFVTSSSYGIPMLLSMYGTVLIDQFRMENTEELNDAIEAVFNQIALLVENDSGGVLQKYSQVQDKYLELRDKYFVIDQESGLYSLKDSVVSSGIILDTLLDAAKELEAELYRRNMDEYLTSKKVDQDLIDKVIDKDNSKAAAYMAAHLLFDNVKQKGPLETIKTADTEGEILDALINNQHFKELATVLNNITPLSDTHLSEVMNAWLRIDDPYYLEFTTPDDAQRTGYRRVYLPQPAGVNLTGSVMDARGRTAATFKNGKLTSRTDEWIGITTSDKGSWLRIPAGDAYKVYIGTDKACTYGLKVEEYSIELEGVAQTIDGGGSWKNISSAAGGSVVLTLPALEAGEEYYEMPSDPSRVKYTLDTSGSVQPAGGGSSSASVDTLDSGVLSSDIPAVKSMKTKAAKKSFTVSWKKPSGKKLKKYNKVEIQYSTSPEFTADTTKVKEVSKNKRSCKIKKLTSKTTYYVRTRNIKYSYSRKYVSKWSKVKKVKVK